MGFDTIERNLVATTSLPVDHLTAGLPLLIINVNKCSIRYHFDEVLVSLLLLINTNKISIRNLWNIIILISSERAIIDCIA